MVTQMTMFQPSWPSGDDGDDPKNRVIRNWRVSSLFFGRDGLYIVIWVTIVTFFQSCGSVSSRDLTNYFELKNPHRGASAELWRWAEPSTRPIPAALTVLR